MNKIACAFNAADRKLDAVSEKLKDKKITLPTELLGAGLFLVLAVVMLVIMPGQVAVSESDVVNGRVFPTLLIVVTILCCAGLLISGVMKKVKHQPVSTCTLDLLTELKALIILAILFLTYLICKWTDLFVCGACFCSLAFLLYYRCRKWQYYAITLSLSVIIWAAFRFGLGVRF